MSAERRVAALEGLLARVTRNAARPRAIAAPMAAPMAAVAVAPPALEEEDLELVTVPPPALRAEAASPGYDDLLEDLEPAAASGVQPLLDELETEGELELDSGELIDVTDLGPEEVAAIEAEAAEAEAAEAEAAEAEAAEAESGEAESGEAEAGEAEAAEAEAAEAEAGEFADNRLDAEEEPVPSSSRRAKPAASMDEALASAAAAADAAEREVPLQTPPPESGRQVAAPAFRLPVQAGLPDDLLEVGTELPDRDLRVGPTTEQLGETIDLDEPLGGDLELDQASTLPTPRPPAADELEHQLPAGAPGTYDASLELPPGALEDLARHRAIQAPPPPAPLAAAVVARPPLYAQPAEVVGHLPPPEPRSFLQLLDGSLSL